VLDFCEHILPPFADPVLDRGEFDELKFVWLDIPVRFLVAILYTVSMTGGTARTSQRGSPDRIRCHDNL